MPRPVDELLADARARLDRLEAQAAYAAAEAGEALIVDIRVAATTLQELGSEGATDLAGGFQAWRGAGLPVDPFDD